MFTTRISQNLLLGGATIVLVALVLWGVVAGSRAGKSTVVLKNTQSVSDGLKLFFRDQNRYPSTQEFVDQNIMLQYFSVFPFANIVGGSCTKTFSYYSANQQSYELSFCLPKAMNGFAPGWNKLTQP